MVVDAVDRALAGLGVADYHPGDPVLLRLACDVEPRVRLNSLAVILELDGAGVEVALHAAPLKKKHLPK